MNESPEPDTVRTEDSDDARTPADGLLAASITFPIIYFIAICLVSPPILSSGHSEPASPLPIIVVLILGCIGFIALIRQITRVCRSPYYGTSTVFAMLFTAAYFIGLLFSALILLPLR